MDISFYHNQYEAQFVRDAADQTMYICDMTHRPEQNGCHFADIFKCIYFKKFLCIFILIALELGPMGPTGDMSELVLVMV